MWYRSLKCLLLSNLVLCASCILTECWQCAVAATVQRPGQQATCSLSCFTFPWAFADGNQYLSVSYVVKMSWVPGALCWVCSAKQDLLCSQSACCHPHRSAGELAAVVLWPQRSILYGRTKSNVTQCNIFLCDFFQLPLQQLKTSLHELSLEAPPFFWLSLV